MEPEQLVDILRRYFDGMCGIVQSHGGPIERLFGDGLVAFFNAPVDQADHPQRAVQCAQLPDSFSQRFEEGQIAAYVPVGKHRLISVFEPINENSAVADSLHDYPEAYESLTLGEPEALALFEKLAQSCPTDGLVLFHLKRILAGGTGARIEFADK